MTGGDYVFFTTTGFPTSLNYRPWLGLNMTGQDINYRIKAFYSVKEVRYFVNVCGI